MKIAAGIIFLTALVFSYLVMSSPVSAISGCFCGANSSCYSDGCTRKTIKGDGSIDYNLCGSAGCGGAYSACYQATDVEYTEVGKYFCTQQPPCCKDMVERNDPEACCWPERGFCHPYFCAQVSRPEKCGWYWTFHDGMTNREQGYGCMKGPDANHLTPNFGLPPGVPGAGQPTTPPTTAPTATPTKTAVATTAPTHSPITTSSPTVKPGTASPNPTNRPAMTIPTGAVADQNTTQTNDHIAINNPLQNFVIKLPQSQIIKERMKIAAVSSAKILDLPGYLAGKIINLDRQLENFINEKLIQLIPVQSSAL
ncbi:hypothetical protein M1523_02030 [Patescibacteria group bacterium]|nr:hypothetical protein [Patescibacteria group bacterium]MCL5091990.1 hypothetical protein [Patescibacteria group bacterium]